MLDPIYSDSGGGDITLIAPFHGSVFYSTNEFYTRNQASLNQISHQKDEYDERDVFTTQSDRRHILASPVTCVCSANKTFLWRTRPRPSKTITGSIRPGYLILSRAVSTSNDLSLQHSDTMSYARNPRHEK